MLDARIQNLISESAGNSNVVYPPLDITEFISKLSGNPFFIEFKILRVSKTASNDV